MELKNQIQSIIVTIIIVVLFSVSGIAKLFTDFYWFSALGFSQVFTISLKSKIYLFIFAALLFYLFAGINLWISSRLQNKTNLISKRLKLLIVVVLGFFIGSTASAHWFKVLQYLYQIPFGITDPIFSKDVSFYIFNLPFYNAVWGIFFSIISITLLITVLNYLQSIKWDFRQTVIAENVDMSNFNLKQVFSKIKQKAVIHMTFLASLVFVLLALRHYLAQFSIMYSEKGIVVGAGYTDVVVYLSIVKILMVFAAIVALILIVWVLFFSKNQSLRKRHVLIYLVVLYLIFGFIGPTVIPALAQTLIVSPNEINYETPYIKHNIEYTKIAYGLNDVSEKDYFAASELDQNQIASAKDTIDNIRILDWRPLTQTYKQTQEIRLYYDLSSIDIDRYVIDGNLTEVMLSPRELNQKQIADNAKTWVNMHQVYTHGYGVVMSPVNKVTDQGLPYNIIKNIPPINTIGDPIIDITQPQIYYGEQRGDYVLVNTKTNEFDYPKGNTNEYINYDGKGGVQLNSFWKKLLMAIRFTDIKILLSSDVGPESKIMFQRTIQERIGTIAPFIALDYDPYIVLDKGKVYWIQDGYTVSSNFPYSEKTGSINYIRNSVKIIMDAYDGTVTYYVVDPRDPIINTFARIFPGMLRPITEMPRGLLSHIRYPEDLFKIQSNMYTVYHMNDPKVFYNKEDAWQIPQEIYGVGQKVQVEPYYIIMKLPGEISEEFVLMTSFTPIRKDNMIAWMAARSDGAEYGKLILYKFPKDKLVYGPLQIEARIDQDSEISQQLTLWSQQGSRVTRGNLLVIPINNSILYVEPLYIQAEQGQLPELKRVLVSDGVHVVMEQDLGTALAVLFGEAVVKKPIVNQTGEDTIGRANELYQDILSAMENGDWVGFGNSFSELGKVLEDLTE